MGRHALLYLLYLCDVVYLKDVASVADDIREQRCRNAEPSMRQEDILKLPSMPAAGPSYPAGPYRFVDREFLVITYETDADLIRAALPEPLDPIENPIVHYEWIKMPDSSGFGSYTESGLVIPARLHG